MKKLGALLIGLCIFTFGGGILFANGSSDYSIALSSTITVNGEAISSNADRAVYMTKVTETHEDVPEGFKGVENTVVNITDAGEYRITGTIDNGQIVVNAGNNDNVTLVLDNATINCRTAPAILIKNAYDPQTAGNAGVMIVLADNSTNNISGSGGENNSGAVSSDVSVTIEGNGTMNIESGGEGIETKRHLTVNSGNLYINSSDDAINASEDGVSHVIINGGFVYAEASLGAEGDAIDSNGYLTINGGTVLALSHQTSQDSGLDADMGVFINGGTVVGIGNMASEVTNESSQVYMQLLFASRQEKDTLVTITDTSDNAVVAFKAPQSFMSIVFSTPDLQEGVYYAYTKGDIAGDVSNGLYSHITSFQNGVRLQHFGSFTGMNGAMGRPQGAMRPNGMEPPRGMEPPENMTRPGGMGAPPEGGMARPDWMPEATGSENAVGSIEFVLKGTERMFRGVGEAVAGEGVPDKDEIKVMLKNEYLAFDVAPIIENGRTLVPLRAVFEGMGMEVAYNDGEITAIKEGLIIKTTVGSNVFYKNGEEITLDVGSKIVNGRTLVPVRFIAESAGLSVEYDESTKTVIID